MNRSSQNVFPPNVRELRWQFNTFRSTLGGMRSAIHALLLCACATLPGTVAPPPDCAAGYQAFVGVQMDAVAMSPRLPHRIIPPGTAVTMDFSPNRVNFDLDAGGRITRVWCG